MAAVIFVMMQNTWAHIHRHDQFGQKLPLPFPRFITTILKHKGYVFLADEPTLTSPTFERKYWHCGLLSLYNLTDHGRGSDEEGGTVEDTPTSTTEVLVPPPCARWGAARAPPAISTSPNEPFTMTQA